MNLTKKMPFTKVFMGIGLFALLKFVDALAEVAATFGNNGYMSPDIDYLNAIIWAIVAGFCLIIAVIAAIAEVQKCAETKLTISVKEILIVGVAITLVYLLRIWIVNARHKELDGLWLILEALSFIAIGGSLMVVFQIWIKNRYSIQHKSFLKQEQKRKVMHILILSQLPMRAEEDGNSRAHQKDKKMKLSNMRAEGDGNSRAHQKDKKMKLSNNHN